MPQSLIPAPAQHIQGRDALERYVEQLNRASPVAERRIRAWATGGGERLRLSALAHPGRTLAEGAWLAECRLGFTLALQRRAVAAAASPGLVVGLMLAGRMSVLTERGITNVQAGEGVVLDPAAVESSTVEAGSHFVELSLPRAEIGRLCGEGAPEWQHAAPHFAPRIAPGLAHKLAFMVARAAESLGGVGAPGHASASSRGAGASLAQRWTELLALTLLHEQPIANVRVPAQEPAWRGPMPASVRRALDFIQAHADSDIALADLAQAACTSPRSLLRHFQAHVGTTPAAWLRKVRLERARDELRADGAAPIRDIAWRWGFQNASKFSHAYRLQFGESPSEARRWRRSGTSA